MGRRRRIWHRKRSGTQSGGVHIEHMRSPESGGPDGKRPDDFRDAAGNGRDAIASAAAPGRGTDTVPAGGGAVVHRVEGVAVEDWIEREAAGILRGMRARGIG
jgi:hypothetical protein